MGPYFAIQSQAQSTRDSIFSFVVYQNNLRRFPNPNQLEPGLNNRSFTKDTDRQFNNFSNINNLNNDRGFNNNDRNVVFTNERIFNNFNNERTITSFNINNPNIDKTLLNLNGDRTFNDRSFLNATNNNVNLNTNVSNIYNDTEAVAINVGGNIAGFRPLRFLIVDNDLCSIYYL